jgi:S1-C subfamily serine protease
LSPPAAGGPPLSSPPGGGGATPATHLDSVDDDDGTIAGVQARMDAVVKVYATHAEPNFSLPWQRRRQASSTSSGFIIAGGRLLTNAHCVEHATSVKVRRRGHATKFAAQVLAVGVECDLALLAVLDPGFWESTPPAVTFGDTPRLQTRVVAVGFPLGGDTVCTTSGVVSRVEVQPYTHGGADLLAISIDAAINSGQSGGAVFSSTGQVVGVSFQSMAGTGEAELVGHAIPTPIVQHFLDDYERHDAYTGFPVLGAEWQRLESPSTRAALGMQPGQTGVFVRRVDRTAPASAVLAAGDVLLSLDGVAIGNDGTVPFARRQGERVAFSHLISTKFVGDGVRLSILRGGKARTVTAALHGPSRLAPVHLSGRAPSYFVWGGLAFTPLSIPLLRSEYGAKDYEFEAPLRLLELATGWSSAPSRPGQQVVLLSQVLAADASADVTFGLEDFANVRVAAVDGAKIESMAGLVAALEGAAARARCLKPGDAGRFVRLQLDYGQFISVDAAAAAVATRGVLETHSIEHDRSADLRGGGGGGGGEGGEAANSGAGGRGGRKKARR